MKPARSVYADLYVKGSFRARFLPRVARPWRPRVIAWAGPTAFYPNRFYKLDKWYKARIDKPEKLPQLHVIDPDRFMQSLDERLSVEEPPRINIGFRERSFESLVEKQSKEDLERLARKHQLKIDLGALEHSSTAILNHFCIFDDLFGARVFFHVTQRLRVCFGGHVVYSGNVLAAQHTEEKPEVAIETLGSGYTTLVAVNLDGNPYVANSEVLHWLVSNIPDGKGVGSGCEEVPWLQALPFRGTGYQRLVFLLFRHDKEIDLSSYKLKSLELADRTFLTRRFYKENEELITPSSVAFVQTVWDMSVNRHLHALDLKAPFYKYEYNMPMKIEQKEFPNKMQPFDLYLDQFRDPVEMETEILKKRLASRTVETNPQKPVYPDIDYFENKKRLAVWQHEKLIKENTGAGRNYALWNNPID